MGKLRFKVHPLFIILGIYFAFTGKVFSFIIYTLCALIHELGHSITAQKCGYKLVNITLMPFGAVVKGDISGMGYLDEIRVALAGPFINLAIGVGLVALWWVFPESYPYTELAAFASLTLALINLIPAFPLDGGRVLLCTLSLFLSRKIAVAICKGIGVALSLLMAGLFVYSCFIEINLSLLLFALFMFFGVIDKSSGDRFVRIFEGLSPGGLKNGKRIKSLAVSDDFTVRRLCRKIDGGYLYRVYVYDGQGKIKSILEPHEVISLLQTKPFDEKIV